ncbi:MAG: type II toxin-antitoxin system VapC family toxin [Chloroflexi bacterium]|nr:MAG: type II toxin-antitoxin system VapC family toxin [Chloroflexota bacterium]
MTYLLDAHTLLWFVAGDATLPLSVRNLIEDRKTRRFVSIATLWEIAIKVNLGKLTMAVGFKELAPHYLLENDMSILPISVPHLQRFVQLPYHHRDPFDRLLIAQSIVEDMPILSRDGVFDAYDSERIWG